MQKQIQKPKKDKIALKIPDKMTKKASNREMLRHVLDKQEKQDEKLDSLSEKIVKIETEFHNYVEHGKANKTREESVRKEKKEDKRYKRALAITAIGWLITVLLFILKLVLDG
jgi:hypothetical protein